MSADTVRRWADAGRVKATQGSGGRRYVDGADLARLAVELAGEQGRERSRGQSARNRFRGIVTHVTKDGVAAQVEVQSGPHRFVALITREAADDLELEPGMIADAVVKATNVGVEVPTEHLIEPKCQRRSTTSDCDCSYGQTLIASLGNSM